MDKFRHCCYILGNNQEEALENCEKYDKKTHFKKTLFLAELMDFCTNKKKKEYVNKLLS